MITTELVARVTARLVGPRIVTCFNSTKPYFALTFDDGPDLQTTPPLLEALARQGARATFFVLGERARDNPGLLRRIVAEGHELGNHLMRDTPSIALARRDFDQQLARVQEMLKPYGGSRWFRPGSGWITPRMLETATRLNLRCVLGSSVGRHRGAADEDFVIARHLTRGVRPGSILVLHEGRAERQGVAATTMHVLEHLAGRGLMGVTVSELAQHAEF